MKTKPAALLAAVTIMATAGPIALADPLDLEEEANVSSPIPAHVIVYRNNVLVTDHPDGAVIYEKCRKLNPFCQISFFKNDNSRARPCGGNYNLFKQNGLYGDAVAHTLRDKIGARLHAYYSPVEGISIIGKFTNPRYEVFIPWIGIPSASSFKIDFPEQWICDTNRNAGTFNVLYNLTWMCSTIDCNT